VAETTKKRPRVSILERRLQNPFGEPSSTIEFTDKTIAARWFNDDVRNGQVHRAKELGWELVTMDMIANKDSLGHHGLGPAGEITRGERGREVLMWMPKTDRDAIQAAKTAENNRRMSNPSVQRNETLEAYGRSNAEGADFIDSAGGVSHAIGNVRTTRERIQRTPEVE
jgi:hypothetical protein